MKSRRPHLALLALALLLPLVGCGSPASTSKALTLGTLRAFEATPADARILDGIATDARIALDERGELSALSLARLGLARLRAAYDENVEPDLVLLWEELALLAFDVPLATAQEPEEPEVALAWRSELDACLAGIQAGVERYLELYPEGFVAYVPDGTRWRYRKSPGRAYARGYYGARYRR